MCMSPPSLATEERMLCERSTYKVGVAIINIHTKHEVLRSMSFEFRSEKQ